MQTVYTCIHVASTSTIAFTSWRLDIVAFLDPSATRHEHLDKRLHFLVGRKGTRKDVMALGGPWSATLDGGNPAIDDSALVRTV